VPAGLPAWSVGLPLWAASRWLWLVTEASGALHYWRGAPGEGTVAGRLASLGELGSTELYPMVVLDCRAMVDLPVVWWGLLAGLLAHGGLLLICSTRDNALPANLLTHEPQLQPVGWHIIEPGQEGNWHLRPEATSMRVITHDLQPPYSTIAWLRRKFYRWMPQSDRISCLPVWRAVE
jgi:hypothetical protein